MRYAIAGVVLVAAVAAFIYAGSILVEKQRPTTTIVVDESGFHPAAVEIAVGERVRFENQGSSWHWPASDLHPTHELYSDFDPREPIAPGESWTFTFREVGTWRMHDHLQPQMRGTVTVTP